MKVLVLGLGNPVLTDDGVGIYVARAVAQRCSRSDITFAEASVGGLRLLEIIAGYERVVIVDAIQTANGQPGDLYRLNPSDLHVSLHVGSTHDLSLVSALALGRGLDIPLPQDEAVTIIAVEVEDITTFGETCTPRVQAVIPQVAQMVHREVISSTDCQVAKFEVSS
jgi:hydrogenase maturation protease